MPLVIARAIPVPEATFEQKCLPSGCRIVDQARVVVASCAPRFAVTLVNIGIRPAEIRPVAVSKENVNA
jgi:hypothetical protein